MSLSLNERQRFYEHLGQMLRAGIGLPKGIDKLATLAQGPVGKLLQRISQELAKGATAAGAFATLRGEIGLVEQTMIASCERSGQLEAGCRQLSEYFGSLDRARKEILRKSAYPLVVLHFAVLLVKVPLAFTEGSSAYLAATLPILFILWAGIAIVALLVPILRDAGATSATVDHLLNRLPGVGKIRRAFAVSRFVEVYELQLNAGVNVLDAIQVAARASRSGALRAAMRTVVPGLRRGEQVGSLLAATRTLPASVIEEWVVAEETGELERTLPHLGILWRQDAFARLERFSDWAPRILYFGVIGVVAWFVIRGYQAYLQGLMDQMGSF